MCFLFFSSFAARSATRGSTARGGFSPIRSCACFALNATVTWIGAMWRLALGRSSSCPGFGASTASG